MSQGKRILWVDNDKAFTTPFVMALENQRHTVEVEKALGKAALRLKSEQYDLMILDVMIPTKNEDEEQEYLSDKRDEPTGLIFYRRMKNTLDEKHVRVLVMTVRLDEEVRKDFLIAGLPENCFTTKFELRKMGDFLKRISTIIGGGDA